MSSKAQAWAFLSAAFQLLHTLLRSCVPSNYGFRGPLFKFTVVPKEVLSSQVIFSPSRGYICPAASRRDWSSEAAVAEVQRVAGV